MSHSNGSARDSGANGPKKPAIQRLTWVDPMQKAGEELIASYQLIEEAWKKAEAKLALSHIPVEEKVKVGDTEDIGHPDNPLGERTKYLGYMKLKNQWRICYIEEDYLYCAPPEMENNVSCRPITESPVEIRLEMFDHFERLYNKVMEVTKGYAPRIKDKVMQFESALEMIDL